MTSDPHGKPRLPHLAIVLLKASFKSETRLCQGFTRAQDHHMDLEQIRTHFRDLHSEGSFVMPNAHDLGSCRLLSTLGFDALATTSGGFATSMGRMDMTATRHDLVATLRRSAKRLTFR